MACAGTAWLAWLVPGIASNPSYVRLDATYFQLLPVTPVWHRHLCLGSPRNECYVLVNSRRLLTFIFARVLGHTLFGFQSRWLLLQKHALCCRHAQVSSLCIVNNSWRKTKIRQSECPWLYSAMVKRHENMFCASSGKGVEWDQ